jgi:hypothetical protein
VKTRPVDVAVKAKALVARAPTAMAIVKNCLIGEAPFRRARHERAHLTSTDYDQNVVRLKGMQHPAA